HSMGALTALEIAATDPRRVSRLVLAGAAVPMTVSSGFLEAARDEPPVGLEMEAVWGHARAVPLSSSGVPGTSLLDASRRLNRRSKPGTLFAALSACNSYSIAPAKLGALAVPTLVIAGRRDQMTPYKRSEEHTSELQSLT